MKRIARKEDAARTVRDARGGVFLPNSFIPFVNFCSKVFVFPDFLPASTRPPEDEARTGEVGQLQTCKMPVKRELGQLCQLFFRALQ